MDWGLLSGQLTLNAQAFSTLELAAALALFVAFVEVLVLCSLLLRASRPLLGDVAAVFYVALLFGVARFATFPLPYAALTVVEGVWLAWLTLRTRSVLPAVVAHGLMLIAFYAAAALFGS
jgi:membrane protease YdiL (CAAX protease family)